MPVKKTPTVKRKAPTNKKPVDMDLDDTEYVEPLGMEGLISAIKEQTTSVPMDAGENDAVVETQLAHRDRALWETEGPDNKTEARFLRNQRARLLRGIPRKHIDLMTIRDRVTSAQVLFNMEQLLLDKPTANISFEKRREMHTLLPILQQEMARREQERQTIDISPEGGDDGDTD